MCVRLTVGRCRSNGVSAASAGEAVAPVTTVKTAASTARDTPVGELEQLRDCMAADHSASRKRAVIVPGMLY